jgi:hypothetical protein
VIPIERAKMEAARAALQTYTSTLRRLLSADGVDVIDALEHHAGEHYYEATLVHPTTGKRLPVLGVWIFDQDRVAEIAASLRVEAVEQAGGAW